MIQNHMPDAYEKRASGRTQSIRCREREGNQYLGRLLKNDSISDICACAMRCVAL